jgi:hypothetical protein
MVRNYDFIHKRSLLWLTFKQLSWQKQETATLSRQTGDQPAPYSVCSM